MPSRREFMKQVGKQIGGVAVAASLPASARLGTLRRAAHVRFGYASITWNENDRQAIDDISALGFPGIQLRSNVLTSIGRDPHALRTLLDAHHLTFVALSSGNVSIEPAEESQTVDEHVAHARWLKDAGGLYLQLIADGPRGRPSTLADQSRLGEVLTAIGKRTAEIGIPVVFHPHVGSLSETPAQTARVLQATDPRYVHLLLDVAHWQQGGGDPVAAIHQYRDRLLMLHIKDVRPSRGRAGSYEFVELGRGTVDLPGVFRALRDVQFDGWGVVELDRVPEDSRTPAESAATSKDYLERVLGMKVG
jgi:inosose dehydratase